MTGGEGGESAIEEGKGKKRKEKKSLVGVEAGSRFNRPRSPCFFHWGFLGESW